MDLRPDLDTQTKIAHRTGVSQSTIQRVLTKEVHTSIDVVAALATAFGVTPQSLITPISTASKSDTAGELAPTYDERRLLLAWRQLNDTQRSEVLGYMNVANTSRRQAHSSE